MERLPCRLILSIKEDIFMFEYVLLTANTAEKMQTLVTDCLNSGFEFFNNCVLTSDVVNGITEYLFAQGMYRRVN